MLLVVLGPALLILVRGKLRFDLNLDMEPGTQPLDLSLVQQLYLYLYLHMEG